MRGNESQYRQDNGRPENESNAAEDEPLDSSEHNRQNYRANHRDQHVQGLEPIGKRQPVDRQEHEAQIQGNEGCAVEYK